MADFDAEVYLRRLGERTLLDREHFHRFSGPVVDQARVLAAVGALDTAIAQRVVDDYGRADAIRGIGGLPHHRPPTTPVAVVPARRRIIPCDRTISQPWGEFRLRYLSLSDAETRLALTLRAAPTGSSPRSIRHHHLGPFATGGPPPLTVTDDRGTVGSGGFSGGGSDEEWRGAYEIQPKLAPDTGWIELFGERIDLGAGVDDRAVRIDTFTDTDPSDVVNRCLDRCLAGGGRHPDPPFIEDVTEALTAAGLLRADDPRIAESLSIRAALDGYGAPASTPREPWRSLLNRRGRTGGPEARLMIGAVTPVFDQVSAALLELESAPDGFHCEFELTGHIALGMHGVTDISAVTLSFTAVDDRGNHYLGQTGGWSGSAGRAEGVLDFWPALDARAQRLDLVLTTDHARATITVPLTWTTP